MCAFFEKKFLLSAKSESETRQNLVNFVASETTIYELNLHAKEVSKRLVYTCGAFNQITKKDEFIHQEDDL